jgi:hypothetical protein
MTLTKSPSSLIKQANVSTRESNMPMKKVNGTCVLGRLLIAASSMVMVACGSDLPGSKEQSDTGSINPIHDFNELDALTERQREYEEVFQQARQQGLVSGGLRGALVGALISGEGAGAAAGAILGALIGRNYSVAAAEKFLLEREEFLNRQAIVDIVLSAARSATDQTEQDAQLVSAVVQKYSQHSFELDVVARQQVSAATASVSRAAELRALVIEESLQESETSASDAEEIRFLLNRQINAMTRIRELQNTWNSDAKE